MRSAARLLCPLLLVLASCSDDSSGTGGAGGSGVTSSSSAATTGATKSASVTTAASTSQSSTASSGTGGEGGAGGFPEYPPGPYGLTDGDVIDDHELLGIVDPSASTDVVSMRLGDLYNPTGTGMFEMGSPFPEGTPKPKALLLTLCTVWAGPCGFRADTLPAKYDTYDGEGGEFLFVLEEGPGAGDPPTEADLVTWVTNHPSSYPNAIDPNQVFAVDLVAYPTNLVIDLATMTIEDVYLGVPPDMGSTWTAFDQILGL